ncbi:hypothetical protein SEPCBS119000_002569 [Sporothrix epigloea]|uniref:Impact N-terminal domain-containing protein n=1 Tax=Sporothrix epigloea TaxID=1892477 RepID=A0ABP0DJL0_9PEZI
MVPTEDLADEIEAVNSIYGVGTLLLVAGGDEEILADLAVPASANDASEAVATEGADEPSATGHRLCLRLWFPAVYPACAEPPAVLGVQSVGRDAGHRRPGAAARDAERFGAALAAVFQEGQVCLYDAVEEFLHQQVAAAEEEEEEGNDHSGSIQDDTDQAVGLNVQQQQQQQQQLSEVPPWTVADPVVELKSTFLARCAPVHSPAQASAYIQHLKDTDKRVRSATHNMTAWRIRGIRGGAEAGDVTYQDCDDDGETAAGGRLLHLMQLMDLWDVVVVVTRWYGGHKLGPRRFALINQAARDAFVRAGLVPAADPGGKKKK